MTVAGVEKKTPLYGEHVRAGARIVPFGGFLMPIQYRGIIDEHRAVRQRLGMFDLSHMGELRVSGPNALAAVAKLVTNDVLSLEPGQIRYTPMCYPDGGIVDDLLVYRFPDHIMLVVNASNIEKDLAWIREHLAEGVEVRDVSDETALIAVQGPKSERFLQQFTEIHLASVAYYHFVTDEFDGVPAVISRTGYTGEDGFELYLADGDAPAVWRNLSERGRDAGLRPVGLGARDTLRLEAGLMLYGNDIDRSTSPIEAGLGWTVKFGSVDFIGREVLERQKAERPTRRLVAIEMDDRSIPRPHQAVLAAGERVGELTSGTFSPTLQRGIALGYVDTQHHRVGTELEVEIRNERHPGRIVKKPVYRREVEKA